MWLHAAAAGLARTLDETMTRKHPRAAGASGALALTRGWSGRPAQPGGRHWPHPGQGLCFTPLISLFQCFSFSSRVVQWLCLTVLLEWKSWWLDQGRPRVGSLPASQLQPPEVFLQQRLEMSGIGMPVGSPGPKVIGHFRRRASPAVFVSCGGNKLCLQPVSEVPGSKIRQDVLLCNYIIFSLISFVIASAYASLPILKIF